MMTRRKAEDAELRKVQARVERELKCVEPKLVEWKAELKRLRNRNRMRDLRSGQAEAIRALSKMPFGEFRARLRELFRNPRPGPPDASATTEGPCGQGEEIHKSTGTPARAEEADDEE